MYPTAGSIEVHGRVGALIELRAGIHPELTGRENVRLNGSILGLTRREIDGAIDEIIDFSGLDDFIDEPVKNYSSGMYVRLGFSVAVHMRPDVLLIDEIIAVGDEDFQRKCFDHLYALRQSGKTFVIVSHASTLMGSFCDEVAWLDHGSLRNAGPAQTVIDGYIDSVNADGGSSRGRSTAHDAAQRQGSGLIRLSSVESLDEDGAPSAACVTGRPLRLRVAFEAFEAVAEPVVQLTFQHESGPVVTTVSTRATGDKLDLVEGPGRVDYVQDECRLNPGNYAVHASVMDASGTHVFDAWPDALDLVVRAGAGPQRGGLVSLPDAFDTSRSRAVSDTGGV
jgi:ABC-2 type transport system ATP-binding protein/lipopolysaccharide transport system ATP-binding protein